MEPKMSEEAQTSAEEETTASAEPAETEKTQAEETTAEKKTNGKDEGEKTLAAGGEEKAEEPAPPYWPKDWIDKVAEHAGAGDAKAVKKEVARLKRLGVDPPGLYGLYRDLESKFTGGGLVKVPGKEASEEDIAAYHKAIGVPDKKEDYFENITLESGAVIGEADKPIVDAFAEKMHEAGASQPIMDAAVGWYLANQEEQAADLDQSDDTFRRESETALKEEMGATFNRKTNAIAGLFSTAPGGTDLENEEALYGRLLGGRMADGKLIGDDPDMVRFLVSMAHEMNPSAMVVEDGDQTGKSVDSEIKDIEKIMKTDKREYFKNHEARYLELIEAREKIQARARA